jgi:sugar phosphate isomerase/epimerase
MNKERLYDLILPTAEKLGITVATENMFSWKDETETETVPSACGTAADFVEHIDIVSHPNCTACLDLGHAQMVNCEGAVALIRALGGKRIGALHVHDNDLYHDDHIFPFAGQSNWDEITSALAEIGYQGCFTYEADTFMRNYPNELIPACLHLLVQTGRYLIGEIERKRK